MRPSVRTRASALVGAALVALAGVSAPLSAHAAPTPPPAPQSAESEAAAGWSRISGSTPNNLSEPGTHRAGDGTLHVVHHVEQGATDNYIHSTIAPDGTPGPSHQVFTPGWGALTQDPTLLPVPGGGLRLVFSGLQDTDSGNFFSKGHVYHALSNDGGGTWTTPPEALTKGASGYSSYGTSALALPDGSPLVSVTLNQGIRVRSGVIPAAAVDTAPPDLLLSHPACCTYSSTLVQTGGAVWLAYYANGDPDANRGVFVQQVAPAVGPLLKAPGSSATSPYSGAWAPDQAVAAVARPGGGMVVAYCGYLECGDIRLWDVASGQVRKVPATRDVNVLDLHATPSGRLWVAWTTPRGKVGAARTSPTGWTFSAATEVSLPPGEDFGYRLGLDATDARADLLLTTDREIYHRQVLPALGLAMSPAEVRLTKLRRALAGQATKVRFTVRVADERVRGARVRVRGEGACTTRAGGTCTLKVSPSSRKPLRVTASKGGYVAAAARLRVR